MEGARERRRNEGNGRVGAMGEERLSFLCIPRPFLHAAEVFYAWRPRYTLLRPEYFMPRSVYGCGREGIGGKGWGVDI